MAEWVDSTPLHPAAALGKEMGFVLCFDCFALNHPWRRTEQGLRCWHCYNFVRENFAFGNHAWNHAVGVGWYWNG
jgi:hypothetical protein